MSKAGLLISAPQTLFCLVFPSQLTGVLLGAPARPPGGPSFSYDCIRSPAILWLCLRTAPASDYPSFPPTPGHHHSAPQLYAVVPVGVPPGPRMLLPQPSSPRTPGRPPSGHPLPTQPFAPLHTSQQAAASGTLRAEGRQKKPSQTLPRRHEGQCEPKALGRQRVRGGHSDLPPLFSLKAGEQTPGE